VAEAVNVIYRTHDSLTGEMYIGSKKNYIHGKYFGSPRNKRAIEIIKTRPETLSVEILETVHDYNLLLEREIYWQQLYDVVNNPLYWNRAIAKMGFTCAGSKQDADWIVRKTAKIKGRKHRPETIEKMRLSAKAVIRKPLSEEHKKNITKGLMGHKSRPRTDEEKAHHSRIMSGKKFPNRKPYAITEDHRNKLSIAIKADWEKRKQLKINQTCQISS
jgi:hypothetical protein